MTGRIQYLANPKEVLPKDAPEPLGKYVTLSHYVDANLMQDITNGKSVTGILRLINKTPLDWYSKKQATVETATYGSEFVAARICVEQIIDLRSTLRYLVQPVVLLPYKFYVFSTTYDLLPGTCKYDFLVHFS
jgi:hypothetical protein